jgi:hypothetical protein
LIQHRNNDDDDDNRGKSCLSDTQENSFRQASTLVFSQLCHHLHVYEHALDVMLETAGGDILVLVLLLFRALRVK